MTTTPDTRSVIGGMGRSATSLSGAGLVKFLELERQYLNEQDKIGLCARVKEARIRAGLEQSEIAEMLDPPVEDRTIRNYESIRPPFKYLRQWAEITGVSYDWLLRGVEPEPVVLAPETAIDLRQSLEALEGRIERQGTAASDSIDALEDRLGRVEDQLARILALLQLRAEGATEGP